MNIVLSGGQDVFSVPVQISYDPQLLQFLTVSNGDFLSKDMPQCRTMIYGYDSKLSSRGIDTITDYGRQFLEGIKNKLGPAAKVVYAKGCEITDERWPESEILPEPLTKKESDEIAQAVDGVRCHVRRVPLKTK